MKKRSEIVFTSKINLSADSMAKLFQLCILGLSAENFSFHAPAFRVQIWDTFLELGFSDKEIMEMIEENES